MAIGPTLDLFFESASNANFSDADLPDDQQWLENALHLSPLKSSDLKKFFRQEISKLTYSETDTTRVFDPNSSQSAQERLTTLLKIIRKEKSPERLDAFLLMYPFLADLEEMKFLLVSCFTGNLEQKEFLFRTLYRHTKKIEKSLERMLNPGSKRDPLRSQIDRWFGMFRDEALIAESFHPAGLSPHGVIDHFFQNEQARAKRETQLYLKNYMGKQIQDREMQLLEKGVDSATLKREMVKYQNDLDSRKQEYFFTYSAIKRLDIVKEYIAMQMGRMVEYLSRSFVLALPDEIFSAKSKEALERSTHMGTINGVGQENNLQRHAYLLSQYRNLGNEALINHLLDYPENAAVLKNRDDKVTLIQNLAKASKTQITPAQLEQNSEKVLNSLLFRLVHNSLRIRTFSHQLDKFMKKHREVPLFPEGNTYDFGGIVYNLSGLLFDHLHNPYQEFYYEVKKITALEWSVNQMAEKDRQAGTCERSQVKAGVYQDRGLEIVDKKGERKNEFFFEALNNKDRCHVTVIRNLELSALSQLPALRFNSLFEDLREEIFKVPGEKGAADPIVHSLSMREEMIGLVQDLTTVHKSYETSVSSTNTSSSESSHNLVGILDQVLNTIQQHRDYQRAFYRAAENRLMALQQPVKEIEVKPPPPEPEEPKEAPTFDRLQTVVPEKPSFRNQDMHHPDYKCIPLHSHKEELEQRLFIRNYVNYYDAFTEVAQMLIEYYDASIIRCQNKYTYDEEHMGTLKFEECVVYLRVDDDHVIAVGNSLLYFDPTLPNTEGTYFVRLFVRNKRYPQVPREKGRGIFKNMMGMGTDEVMNMFEEVASSMIKPTPEANFRSIFKESMLTVIRSLPASQVQQPLVQTFLEYLQSDRAPDPPVSADLKQRITDQGLEDRLVLKQRHELLRDRVPASVKEHYTVLKKANNPLFRARKRKLEAEKILFSQRQDILKQIQDDDKIRLYNIAFIVDLYFRLLRKYPDTNLGTLRQIAGHYYGFKPDSPPEGVMEYLQSQLKLFQKK